MYFTGDAVWAYWWKCLHIGLPVSVLCIASVCSGTC